MHQLRKESMDMFTSKYYYFFMMDCPCSALAR